MSYVIKFTDGSRYVRYNYTRFNTKERKTGAFPNSIILINTDRYKTPPFEKTDLDGHVWKWDGTNFTISGTNIYVDSGSSKIKNNRMVVLAPYNDDNNKIILSSYNTNKINSGYPSMDAVDGIADFYNSYDNKDPYTINDFMTKVVSRNTKKDYLIRNVVTGGLMYDVQNEKNDNGVSFWGGFGGGPWWTLEAFSNIFKKSFSERDDPLGHDPYQDGGTSNGGGGKGTFGGGTTIFGGASDSIDIPPLPTASASSAGFITLFNPSLAQLNNLANYMWSDLFSLDTFKKIFADPMDCILGLSIVPVKPASAGTSAVKIGNISTDVSMNKTSSQYVSVDCGTIDVKEYWGAYLDYAPYTQCEIYLPYVGTKQISVDDVMNKAVHVVYHVDILSGACNAYVKCGDSVLYTFVGQCSSSIPISGNDWTNVLNGAISVAGKIGLAMATGGATALMSGIGAASSIISSSKPTVERSGAMSSTGGLLGIQKPYLILTRPKQALPENQNKYTGYPSFITMALSDCTGYTEVDSVHLENMTCTDEEAQEIENLLKSGVIF